MNETIPPLSFSEYAAKTAETERAVENTKRTIQIASILIKNGGFVGGQIEEEKSQMVEQEILGVFNAGYESVVDIEQTADKSNQSSSDRQKKMASENLGILADAGMIALNYLYRGYECRGLPLDGQTADSIEPLFSGTRLEGVGKYIATKSVFFTDYNDKGNFSRLIKTIDNDSDSFLKFFKEGSGKYTDILKSVIRKNTEESTGVDESDTYSRKRTRSRQPRYGEDGGIEGWDSPYEATFGGLVDGFKDMQNRMVVRYNDYIPLGWFDRLSGSEKEKVGIAMMISEAANGLKNAGKDLEAIMKSREIFGFLNENMSKMFDKDFKLVMSYMLNDLCVTDMDSNGKMCLRYKENENNTKIDATVRKKLSHIRDYEDHLADWLAKNKEGGNESSVATEMDKLNAYTAWNLFYGFGNSSMADRLRSLPTWDGIISDALRTLNPEYKALGKWQVLKAGNQKNDENLIGFEYFTELSTALKRRFDLERDLGHAIDGDKTLRQKIIDGEVSFLSHKMFYGFLDFFNGDRDLYSGEDYKKGKNFYDNGANEGRGDGENFSVAQLLMDYASFKEDKEGKLVLGPDNNKRKEFTFGSGQTTFMNEFRDSLEGATMAFYCLTGKIKVEPKNADSWVKDLKSKLGMVSDLRFSGISAFTYARDPSFWRDILVSIYGEDKRRISSKYIALPRIMTKYEEKNKINPEKISYNMNLLDLLTNDLQLTNNDVDINELMRLLGVKIDKGEAPQDVTAKNIKFEWDERMKMGNLNTERNEKMEYDSVKDINKANNVDFERIIGEMELIRSDNPRVVTLKRDFDKMVKSRSYRNAFEIYREIIRLTRN